MDLTSNELLKINIGQSLIMDGDSILALDSEQWTNKLLELFNNNKSFSELIFVKFKKINQINELDFPVIGPETIKKLIKIKIKAMVLFKNKTLIVDKIKWIKLLKKNNINLIVL